ncbi:6-hydroxymethylpterin diphosphokinase MptE-like protein [Lentibacillus sp. N15]
MRIDKNSPYEKLKEVKNKHKGERCFIVATGPSLTIEDLEKLESETTISMNSICLAFNETNWRPTYYGIQDDSVFLKMRKYIETLDVAGIFVSHTVPQQLNEKLSDDYYYFPIDMFYHSIERKKYNTKFSDNSFAAVYNGYTVTYSLIQIAVYMGFKEIYLIGADCHYGNDMNHHFIDYDHLDPTYASAGDMMTSGYKVAKKYADQNNIKIYNATRGGMLEIFERVDIDELLRAKKQEVG